MTELTCFTVPSGSTILNSSKLSTLSLTTLSLSFVYPVAILGMSSLPKSSCGSVGSTCGSNP